MSERDFFDARTELRLIDGGAAKDTDFSVVRNRMRDGLRVNVKNVSSRPQKIKEVALYAGPADISETTKYYGEGYHMLCQYRGTIENPQLISQYAEDKKFFHMPENPYDKEHILTFYLLQLTNGGEHTLMGFASCHKFIGKFRFSKCYLEIIMDCEDMELAPNAAWDMEELVVLKGKEPDALYTRLADYINANHPPKKSSWGKIPTGWCSFYCVGTFSPEAIYKNAEAMAARIPELEMIQIDAGLNIKNGDWGIWKFDDDLKTACEKVRDAGVMAGGYYSPFIVDNDSRLAAEHPDWLVRDEDNKPTNRMSYKKDWFILDGSHPEARAYLKKLIRYMYDECGLRYFKLDFLSYGALPAGRRYDESKTAVEAYRMGMQAIWEEVGEDSFVLACNAAFWPTLGLCHANRSTNDIFRSWEKVKGNALEQFYRNW